MVKKSGVIGKKMSSCGNVYLCSPYFDIYDKFTSDSYKQASIFFKNNLSFSELTRQLTC